MADGSAEEPARLMITTKRRRLILHVGQHKTGSTYLQKRLVAEREYLRSRGIWYPEEFISIFGHHGIARFFQWKPDEEGIRRVRLALSANEAPTDVAIVSSENFSTLSGERLSRLADVLSGWDVEVVYFLRQLGGFWVSHWQEVIKHGGDDTFPEYLERSSAPSAENIGRIDQAAQLENLSVAFGRENIHVVAYDNMLYDNLDIYEHFLKITVGIDPQAPASGERVNSSFGAERIELLRALNMFYRLDRRANPGPRLRKAYMRGAKRIEASDKFRSFAEAFGRSCEQHTIPPDWEPIRVREQELLSKFAERIVNRASDSSIFHQPPPAQVRYVSRDWIGDTGRANWIRNLMSRLVTRMEEVGAGRA